MGQGEVFTFARACAFLDYSAPTLRKLIHSGKVAASRTGPGGHWRIRRSALEAFLDGRGDASTSPGLATRIGPG
jgi:excisionase family DNA binding protein